MMRLQCHTRQVEMIPAASSWPSRDDYAVPPGLLGSVHVDIGMAEEDIDGRRFPSRDDSDTDADGQEIRTVVEYEWLLFDE